MRLRVGQFLTISTMLINYKWVSRYELCIYNMMRYSHLVYCHCCRLPPAVTDLWFPTQKSTGTRACNPLFYSQPVSLQHAAYFHQLLVALSSQFRNICKWKQKKNKIKHKKRLTFSHSLSLCQTLLSHSMLANAYIAFRQLLRAWNFHIIHDDLLSGSFC